MAEKPAYRNPIPYYRKVFLETWNHDNNKSQSLYFSPIRDTNTIRKAILRHPKYQRTKNKRRNIVGYEEYLRQIAESRFVLSPNGDHPECHRHYEAIGLGAVPITNLNPVWYEHLQEANAYGMLYDNDMSNLTMLQEQLEQLPAPQINRNMIFEEYYMEYIETLVGHKLRWWDVVANQPAYLDDFATVLPEGVKVAIK